VGLGLGAQGALGTSDREDHRLPTPNDGHRLALPHTFTKAETQTGSRLSLIGGDKDRLQAWLPLATHVLPKCPTRDDHEGQAWAWAQCRGQGLGVQPLSRTCVTSEHRSLKRDPA
jgi:hypothetical protein